MRRELGWEMLQCGTCSRLNTITYENLGIRPLLIDKLSNYSTPKSRGPITPYGQSLAHLVHNYQKGAALKSGVPKQQEKQGVYPHHQLGNHE
jgi:hypothetical protein